ncbi:MAG: hypothetical protein V1835_00355 [Candidatus Micrarchaeota archaeon]
MLEIINFFSTIDDLLLVLGVLIIAWGEPVWGLISIGLGLGVMYAKGEILVPIQ